MKTPFAKAAEHYTDALRRAGEEQERHERARLEAIASLDREIRGEQLLDQIARQHGHAAYVSVN